MAIETMQAERHLPDETATLALGHELSLVARPGDVILLAGDLGSGKTSLARGLISALHENRPLEVPSPTFTLMQNYDEGRLPTVHFDFYRLRSAEEVGELGWNDRPAERLAVVEWPERLGASLPHDRLVVSLDIAGAGRTARLVGSGSWAGRIRRLEALKSFLRRSAWRSAERRFFEGDASTRRYERLTLSSRRAVLMDMPARPDGPPVRDGKSYSAIAHLAEDVRAVVAINEGLRARGLSAPELFEADLDNGFLIIEDLGDALYGRLMNQRQPMDEQMSAAVTILADMAASDWPAETPVPGGGVHRLPPYDEPALEIEVELLIDWFWPLSKGTAASPEVRAEFLAAWRKLWPEVMAGPKTWVLRDYHSPNLLWLAEREGAARVGIIDTQDAVLGHPAYDLGSLLQDARVEVRAETARDLLDYYCAYRAAREKDFDERSFRRAFLILATQRLTKVLGIFARLAKRDGKPQYLHHIAKLNRYLEADLQAPVLSELKAWYDLHLPLTVRQQVAGGR
jgi:tRNA threonylcarbamoyl adenosine modification protein YjeE